VLRSGSWRCGAASAGRARRTATRDPRRDRSAGHPAARAGTRAPRIQHTSERVVGHRRRRRKARLPPLLPARTCPSSAPTAHVVPRPPRSAPSVVGALVDRAAIATSSSHSLAIGTTGERVGHHRPACPRTAGPRRDARPSIRRPNRARHRSDRRFLGERGPPALTCAAPWALGCDSLGHAAVPPSTAGVARIARGSGSSPACSRPRWAPSRAARPATSRRSVPTV
jgi:hypothetical protein